MLPPRIALIHALAHSVEPGNGAFARHWPTCVRMNLLDDSLSSDLASGRGRIDEAMTRRFIELSTYAINTGVQGILFTCSAFGPCIEAVARHWPDIPILKPNEAMIAEAAERGNRIGLIASFANTLISMAEEFPPHVDLVPVFADGAMQALDEGHLETHDAIVAQAAAEAAKKGCDVIALAQFSLARAAPSVEASTRLPVLTTINSSIALLRARIEARQSNAIC